MRFQELMPDVLHWLGIRKIHRLVSMSNMKYDAITRSGIEVGERVKIPDDLIPADARVEMDAKMAAGYFTDGEVPDADALAQTKGRDAVTVASRAAARSADLRSPPRDPRTLRQHRARPSTAGRSRIFTHRPRAPRRGGGVRRRA